MRKATVMAIRNRILICIFFGLFIILNGYSEDKLAEKKKADILLHYNKLASEQLELNTDSAYYFITKSLKLIGAEISVRHKADTYLLAGKVYKNRGLTDSTLYFYTNAKSLYEILKDNDRIIQVAVSLSEYYRSVYLLQKAEQHANEAIKMSKIHHLYKHLPFAYNRLAAIVYELSINNTCVDCIFDSIAYKAIEMADSSLYWSKKVETTKLLANNYNIIGASYKNLKNYRKANYYLKESLKIAEQEKDEFEYPMLYRNIGMNFFQIQQFDSAVFMIERGVYWSEKLKINSNLWQNYYAMYLIYEKQKNNEKALYFLKRADSLQLVVYNTNDAAKMRELETKYRTSENELIIAKQQEDIKNRQLQLIFVLVIVMLSLVIIFTGIILIKKIKKQNNKLAVSNLELEKKQTEINKLAEFKDDLMSMIVHDLKNPLSAIINHLYLIEKNTSDFEVIHKVKSIRATASNLITLVSNIIDVRKIEEAGLILNKNTTSLLLLVEETIDELSIFSQQKNIRINNEIKEDVLGDIDGRLIKRVIQNLLSNAIKHTPNNGTISFYTESIDEFMKVCISNTGKQIAEDKIKTLFQRYAQIDIAALGETTSTGLGLLFVKMVIQAHGGEVGVTSNNIVTTFWFKLPKQKIEAVVLKKSILRADFSSEFLQSISTLKSSLKEYQFYETSDILHILNQFQSNHPEFREWKIQLENAVLTSNRLRYQELLYNE